jgi:hypothetical protein
MDHPWVAFEFVRKKYLWSEAPIPPLLHVCRDSRRVLRDYGYQLAFATRSHGPRTWFHFGRDRLYLERRPQLAEEYKRLYDNARRCEDDDDEQSLHYHTIQPSPFSGEVPLLSGAPWDLGPFVAADLRRVKHLVLGRRREYGTDPLADEIESLLPLLPSLKQWSKSAGYPPAG